MQSIKELANKVNHLKVLYVEDEIEVREESSRFFRRFFPMLKTAQNGEEAWELFQESPFDLVITDLKMPIMNGNELIIKIKKHTPSTVTLLMSGISMKIDGEIQADHKLGKPVNFEDFSEFLNQYINLYMKE